MSLLDDENILMDNVKESVNNPFYVLNEYLRDFDIEGFFDADKNIIKNILSAIEIPEFCFYNYECKHLDKVQYLLRRLYLGFYRYILIF